MSLPDTTVKVFRSSDAGAPTMVSLEGTLVTLLDACLVNGYGSVTLDSLSVADDVATATVSAGHGFERLGRYAGPVILIEGAAPAALNGEWRIASVPNATTFTVAVEGIADGAATGTITAKRAPAGWTKPFSDTHKAVYQRASLDATDMLLQVTDTSIGYPVLVMYEAMTGVDTGTGPSTAADATWACTGTSTANARPWTLVADDRAFYLFADPAGNGYWYEVVFFGDILSYVPGDMYHCALIGHHNASYSNCSTLTFSSQDGALARSYTQAGGAVVTRRYSHGAASAVGTYNQPYPHPGSLALHAWPVEIWEATTVSRGTFPGLWNPLHTASSMLNQGTVEDVPQFPKRTFLIQSTSAGSRVLVDITGPWR